MTLDTAISRSDCWRLNCDNSPQKKIIGESDGFKTSACERCASVLVKNGFWRYADG